MAGRLYRLRVKRNRFNYFTYDDYGTICQMIKLVNRPSAEPKHVYVHVYAKDQLSKVGSFVANILNYNGIHYKKWAVFDSVGKKLKFVFDDRSNAERAQTLISAMGTPDSITESKIKTDGTVVSDYGVKVKVDVEKNQDGTVSARQGGNVTVNSGSGAGAVQASATSGNKMVKWIIIGSIVLVIIVAILVVLRKKKVI